VGGGEEGGEGGEGGAAAQPLTTEGVGATQGFNTSTLSFINIIPDNNSTFNFKFKSNTWKSNFYAYVCVS